MCNRVFIYRARGFLIEMRVSPFANHAAALSMRATFVPFFVGLMSHRHVNFNSDQFGFKV